MYPQPSMDFPHEHRRAFCDQPPDGLRVFWLNRGCWGWFLAHNEVMKVDLECCAGRKADERPVRFWLEGEQYWVEDVLDQWYEPDSIFYKLRANDGNLYILRQRASMPDRAWDLVSFREEKKANS